MRLLKRNEIVWRALLSKEIRECGLYAVIALLIEMHYLGDAMKVPLVPFLSQNSGDEIPFMTSLHSTFSTIAIIAAIVIGLHQTVWESWRQTTLFLLHRPIPRIQIFLAKLLTGFLLILGITVPPLLIYCWWAATPGTHASPFFWEFTEPYWRGIGVSLVCYLGAFLTGIRPANLIGSRPWPLITASILALMLNEADASVLLIDGAIVLVLIGLSVSILDTALQREYP
jgi:hypothetical protein